MRRGGHENRKGDKGAARSARITASEVEQVMQAVAPSHRRGRSSANDSASDSWTRAAEVGDTVQWDGSHSSVRAGSPEANASSGGIVEAVEDGFVLVARPTGRGHSSEPYQVPKAALTKRSTGRARLCSPPPEAQRSKRQRSLSGSTPSSVVKDGDTMAAASAASTASTASVWKLGGSQQHSSKSSSAQRLSWLHQRIPCSHHRRAATHACAACTLRLLKNWNRCWIPF